MDYLREPAAIFERSFEIIRREADLAGLPPECHAIALRMIHACGQTDIASDLRICPGVAEAARAALLKGRPVLADCEMAKHGIIARQLPPGVAIICTLNDPRSRELGLAGRTTRSAAAVDLWRPHLAESVVVIGNAPTALFALLDLIEGGAPKPAAIIGLPVGFVGAAEAKAALADDPRGVPFVTLLGRRGGSAMAAAAFNAITAEFLA